MCWISLTLLIGFFKSTFNVSILNRKYSPIPSRKSFSFQILHHLLTLIGFFCLLYIYSGSTFLERVQKKNMEKEIKNAQKFFSFNPRRCNSTRFAVSPTRSQLTFFISFFQLKLQEALRKREKFTKEHEEVSWLIYRCNWNGNYFCKWMMIPFLCGALLSPPKFLGEPSVLL